MDTRPEHLDFTDRAALFARLESEPFDVIVIGAGITGSGVAYDAAARGLRVLLVDRGDIACGTSSRSSKMIHGGLRYLAQGDVALVREAASERQTMRVIAPHLTQLSPFVLPGSWGYVTKLRAGLTTFEKLGKVPDHERHEVWNADELAEREPTIGRDRFGSAVVYPEFLTNDARLTLANARSAARHGAVVATYARVDQVLVDNGQACGVVLQGSLPGEDPATGNLAAVARGAVIVNAAGPWVDAIRQLEDSAAPAKMTMTKGIHVVVPHDRLPITRTVVGRAPDKRSVFAVPVRDVTYLGTTDTFSADGDEWPTIEAADVDYLFEFATHTFDGPPLTHDEIVSIWAGIRPLIGQAGKSPSEISRKDEIWIGAAGVLTVAGGKLSAYRAMAERVVDLALERLGRSARQCSTATEPLVGGDIDLPAAVAAGGTATHSRRLIDLYGSEAATLGGGIASEVQHAVRCEGALTLTDFWVRRSAHAWFSLHPVGADLHAAATAMAALLRWDEARREAEIEQATARHTDALTLR